LSHQDKFITVNGLKLHYLEWVNPSQGTLVMLHGFNNCAATWIPLADKLARYRHVLALDQRGHGDSQWADQGLYGNEHMLGDLTAFLEILGIGRLSIIGHSMGGIVALNYAATHPEGVTRLILEDIGPELSKRAEPRQARMRARKKNVFPTLEEAVSYLETSDPLAKRELLLWEAAYLTRQLPGNDFTWKQHNMFRDPSQPRLVGPTSGRTRKRWQMVSRTICPVLILRGKESDILDDEVARKMAAAMPKAELVTIEGAGHYVHRDNPEQFDKEVFHFLGL